MTPAPPDLPGTPPLQPGVADYFRRFGVWARSNIDNKIDKQQAAPGLLLLSPGGKIYHVTVDDGGALHTSQVTPGTHP